MCTEGQPRGTRGADSHLLAQDRVGVGGLALPLPLPGSPGSAPACARMNVWLEPSLWCPSQRPPHSRPGLEALPWLGRLWGLRLCSGHGI